MKTGSSFFFLATAFLFLGSACTAETTGEPDPAELEWHQWSPAVFTQAENQGRLVLLDLTAEWCTFCRKMDQVTYRDEQVVQMIRSSFIPVRADEAAVPELGERYEAFGRPATVVYDVDGNEIIKKAGYMKPQWMLWFLQAVAENPAPEAHR
ncbi:MAG: DUF255 domain-containing protein [Pseudomonadota bacterium]|nr:DUF255 domain-containing protein [Pseudomonadota bacterium]